MDERRFRAVLTNLDVTVREYDEDTVFAALGVIAERFGWELSKRDPGPECEYCDHYDRLGNMVPIHECPAGAPVEWERQLSPAGREVFGVLTGRSINTTGRWL